MNAPATDRMSAVPWGVFARQAPDLAEFGRALLRAAPAYLATIRKDGKPRVHPVTPIFTEDGMFLFMEPTSPKGGDMRYRSWFALHNGVPDNQGTGGEFWVSGQGIPVEDRQVREKVVSAASYQPADRYVLFELRVSEARCNGYGDVTLPPANRWVVPT